MANNTFEIIGKLTISKESEKFKPYKLTTYDSGWANKELIFNAIAGDNRHMLKIKGGYHTNGKGKVYSFSKAGKSDTGEKIKGEKLEIAWGDRFKPEVVENVAEFKKCVIDLEEYGRRFKLEKALEKLNDGSLTSEEMTELGTEDVSQELENSKNKRKEFIAEADFAEYMHKLITSGKIDNRLFRISGDIVYSEYNGKFYKTLIPSRIYLAEKSAVPSSTGQITVFYNKDGLDSNSLKEKQKHYINCYVRNYDGQRKIDIPCPLQLVIDVSKDELDEKNKKLNTLMVKQFTVKDKTWKEFGVKVNILDGAQKTEITDDMLTDLQKELLELEAITMDEIRKEIGADVYGDKVEEMVIINVARGYTKGSKPTVFIDNDFVITPMEIEDKKETQADEDDIFAGLSDIDIPY
jgi:hypothetical protein